ncbi:hypothetical protein AXF42_Ash014922 [Apostasia shenzhenica]|uniref:Uncharacterized protein n=1 Tax=Apostasia shenzhenica TaxID=1088818 RepID=A0A2I0ALI8_9ASPA|nr:hypothetical protein AXF42_Ash014922 [Apostasia shenzhenica]
MPLAWRLQRRMMEIAPLLTWHGRRIEWGMVQERVEKLISLDGREREAGLELWLFFGYHEIFPGSCVERSHLWLRFPIIFLRLDDGVKVCERNNSINIRLLAFEIGIAIFVCVSFECWLLKKDDYDNFLVVNCLDENSNKKLKKSRITGLIREEKEVLFSRYSPS